MIDDEIILITNIQKGDAGAFDKLCSRYYSNLLRFIYTFVKEFEVAEDLVQDVFLNIWRLRESINTDKSFKSYLFMTARNTALNHLRHQKVISKVLSNFYRTEQETKIDLTSSSAEDLYNQNYLQSELNRALNSLPNRCRMVFYLSRYEELSHKQIAEILDISPKTVNNLLLQALKKLRKRLKHLILI